jgi:uncharacterized DUF497 family protein
MSGYDWDETKAAINLRRHGVSFHEAERAIVHTLAVEEVDESHYQGEARLRITAWSPVGRLLVVIVSVSARRPRIISARRATKRERHAYEDRP